MPRKYELIQPVSAEYYDGRQVTARKLEQSLNEYGFRQINGHLYYVDESIGLYQAIPTDTWIVKMGDNFLHFNNDSFNQLFKLHNPLNPYEPQQ